MALPLRRRPQLRAVEAGARASTPAVIGRSNGQMLDVASIAIASSGVSRELALTIPAASQCRNLIVGTIVQLSPFRYRGTDRLDPGWLLSKPDPSMSWQATIGGTVDDLLFYGRSYWRILERDSDGYPTRARWTPWRDVTPNVKSFGGTYEQLLSYRVAGVMFTVPVEDMIRFDSPMPGVLDYGGPAFTAALQLEDAAKRLSSVLLPVGTLTNTGTEIGTEEARELLADFTAQRAELGVGFLQAMEYQREDVNSADLQLVDARSLVATEMARIFNLPVSMVGTSPTGGARAILYANLSQQLGLMTSTSVAPHLRTLELTLGDALPRGQSVAFDVQAFLRSDPGAVADYAVALVQAGIITVDEARAMLGIPPQGSSATSDLQPGRV